MTVTVSAHDDFEWFFVKDNYIDFEADFITDSCRSVPADDRLTNQRVTHIKDITSRLAYRTRVADIKDESDTVIGSRFSWEPHPLVAGFAYNRYSTRFSIVSTKPALISFTPNSGFAGVPNIQGAYIWDSSVQNSYNIEVPWSNKFNCFETRESSWFAPTIPISRLAVYKRNVEMKDDFEPPLKLCVMTGTGDDLMVGCWIGLQGDYEPAGSEPIFTQVK